MAIETNYGVISDLHGSPEVLETAIDTLKKEGIDKLLLNGDIADTQEDLQSTWDYFETVLNIAGRSGLETYVQPGSHETVLVFYGVMHNLQQDYSNLVNTTHVPVSEGKNHTLTFLPGSDWNAGGEFTIGKDLQTGVYGKNSSKGGLQPMGVDAWTLPFNIAGLVWKGPEIKAGNALRYQNMNDLKKWVKDPDKTIVVCHVPRKFDNIDTCVDMAYFAERADGSLLPGIVVENHIRQRAGDVPYETIENIAKSIMGFTLKTENRGNTDLRDLYEEIGIKKAVSGHFHESGHRANDGNGNHVPQGTFTDELYWNSGHLDAGQTGILTAGDGKVSYRNINFKV